MQPFITRIRTNLNGVLQMTQMIDGIMMTGDDFANQIIVELHRDRTPVAIAAGTKIIGYFIRSDGYTLEIEGSVIDSGDDAGKAQINIPSLAYQIPGTLSIAVRMFVDPSQVEQRGYYEEGTGAFIIVDDPSVTEGPDGEPVVTRTITVYDNKVVIAAASCFVQMTETDAIIEPGHMIPDIQDVIAKIEEMDAKISEIEGYQEDWEDAEDAREAAETSRVTAETARVTAETARGTAETARSTAETARATAEAARISAETSRASAETARASAETSRAAAETARASAETTRVANETTRQSNETTRQNLIQNATASAVGLPYESNPTATITVVDGHWNFQFGIAPGKPFRVKRTFSSVAEMQAYTGTDVELYELVVIQSTVSDPDNAKLYMKVPAPDNWYFLTDLSGAQGIQGPQGIQGETGNGIATAVINSSYQLVLTFTDGTTYTSDSIRGPQGAQGEQGIQGIQGIQGQQGIQGETGNGISSATVDSNYHLQLAFTDGTSYESGSIRGPQGEQGIQGIQGIQGPQGVTGNGISSALVDSNYQLQLAFTDGTTYTSGSIRGPQGIQGEQGPKGDPGTGGADVQYDSSTNELSLLFG